MKSNGNGLRTYAILYLIFLYAPIILLPLFAFNDGTIIAFPLKGFSTRWFEAMWEQDQLWIAVKNSLIVAGCTAVMATTLATFAARSSTRFDYRGKGAILGLIMMPLVLPEMIVAMALLVVVLQVFGDQALGLTTMIAGHTLICTPFAIAIMTASFQSLDKSLEEASMDLGETAWSTFRLIVLPLVMPGIMASFLICFTISFDEFIISNFLGSGQPILSVYIFGQFRFPAKVPSMLALGTVLVCFSIILLGFAEYMRRRGIAKAGGKDSGGFL